MLKKIQILFLILILLSTSYCLQRSNFPTNSFDRSALFQSLTNNVILPTYADLGSKTVLLKQSIDSFCVLPIKTVVGLKTMQDDWLEAKAVLNKGEVFRFGPMSDMDHRINKKINYWPTVPQSIEDKISGLNLDSLPTSLELDGGGIKGFAAMEYLLFNSDPAQGNLKILDSFNDGDNGKKRCAYLTLIVRDIDREVSLLNQLWSPQQGGFASDLVNAGVSSKTYTTTQSVVNDFVGYMIALIENIQSMKLGVPFGKKSAGTPRPDLVESPFSDNSLEDILNNLRGLQSIYTGQYGDKIGPGFRDFLRSKDSTFPEHFEMQLQKTIEAVQAISGPLSKAVMDNTQKVKVQEAFNQMGQLQIILEGQVSSLLGVSVTFNDSDGD